MTTRELTLIRSLLSYLRALEGGNDGEGRIWEATRRAVNPAASVEEFACARDEANARLWIAGRPSIVTNKMRWAITTAGSLALDEMDRE